MRAIHSLTRPSRQTGLVVLIAGVILLGAALISGADDSDCSPPHLRTVNWSTDFCQSIVDFAEILVGNPVKDGIPSVSDPAMESIKSAAEWLNQRSPVIAVQIEDEARAYPLAILMWHEIANDEIAGLPIAVTFCPLCNSSVVFERQLGDEALDFGVSGFLRNSDLIMFDRQSETWWQQLTGEALVGAYAGTLLEIAPSQVISFGSFTERHPDGLVMSRATGYNRQYGTNPYRDYDTQLGRPFLFRGEIDPRLDSPVDHVLAAIIGDVAVAYPFDSLRTQRVVNDVVADTPLVIFYQGGVASALGDYIIDNARDIGTAGMYKATLDDGVALRFVADGDGSFRDEATQSTWNAFGEATAGELEGSQLRWINAFPHFWFAWAAFHPETLVYGS